MYIACLNQKIYVFCWFWMRTVTTKEIRLVMSFNFIYGTFGIHLRACQKKNHELLLKSINSSSCHRALFPLHFPSFFLHVHHLIANLMLGSYAPRYSTYDIVSEEYHVTNAREHAFCTYFYYFRNTVSYQVYENPRLGHVMSWTRVSFVIRYLSMLEFSRILQDSSLNIPLIDKVSITQSDIYSLSAQKSLTRNLP